MTTPVRVALYLRVSTGRQADSDLSIPDQHHQAKRYCEERGWEIVVDYVEPGMSATDGRRPEFQRMIDAATTKPPAFDAIVVHSFSRFFRDQFQLEFYVRRLAKNGVKLVSVTQELGDDPMSNMIRQIMALFDEYQSKENAKHTLRAMKENARQGFWNGSLPPIGYRIVEAGEQHGNRTKKTLEIDPIQAETVRLIFCLARRGDGTSGPMGVKSITKHLNAAGIVLQRKGRGRVRFSNDDRLFFVQLYRWFPSILKAMLIIRPETLIRWHRAGFRGYWGWKSRSLGGRPPIGQELRALIRRMSQENPLWGAPRIHGELLKLGFAVSQSTVAKYVARTSNPPSQSWRTFICNHAPQIAAMDLFVVPTIEFNLLHAFVMVRLARRELIWINVTAHPAAEWIAQQITEAFPWNEAPRYLIRDRDGVYGAVVRRRLRAMGIRDKPISAGSPWQNCFAERLIGSIRRECVDHVVALGEQHLRRVLRSYARYYNETRTHRSLNKDAPIPRPVQRIGRIASHALVSGLHRQYVRT